MDIRIYPPEDIIEVEINLPLSKSVANRIAIMRALAGIVPENRDDQSDDIKSLINGIKSKDAKEVNIGAAGTAMRFLTAFYAATPGVDIILDGSRRMRERPISILVEALRQLGADISYVEQQDFPPLHIIGKKIQGGEIAIDSHVSSQYISALMLIAPYMEKGLTIQLKGDIVSASYLRMTLELLQSHGIEAELDDNTVIIKPGNYQFNGEYSELDWSAASYWAQIVALSAAFVNLPGLKSDSVQGDKNVIKLFKPLGVNVEDSEEFNGVEMCADPEVHSRINIDLTDNPDLAQTIAVTCCLLNIPFLIKGLSTLTIKETDRIAALINELMKLGCKVSTEYNETLEWDGKHYPIINIPEIETYNDHRMAMAFAPAALYLPGLVIKDADVVTKSYPAFWEDLKKAGFRIEQLSE